VKFDRHFARAVDFKETHRPVTVVTHFGVGRVVAHDDVMFVGKVDNALEKILVRHRSRGIIRIIDPQELGLSGNIGGNRIKIRQELVCFCQRQKIVPAAVEGRADVIDGITWARDQNDVAGVDKGDGHVTDPFFGSDQRHDFFVRVELDVETPEIPAGDGLAKFRHARAVRVAVVDGFAGAFLKFFDHDTRCRNVWITDPKVDQIDSPGHRRTFLPVYLGEEVGWQFIDSSGFFYS